MSPALVGRFCITVPKEVSIMETGKKSGTLDQGEETENNIGIIQRWMDCKEKFTYPICN